MNRLTIRWTAAALILTTLLLSGGTAACQPSGDQTIAVVVNGEKITVGDWIKRMQNLRAQDFLASSNPIRFKGATGGQIALDALINGKLLIQYATKTSLLPADSEVASMLANVRKRPEVAQGLQNGQFTEDQVRYDVLVQAAYFNVATVNIVVSPEEIKGYYDRHSDQWGHPERWRLGIIKVTTKEKADKAAAELKGGTPFETVAAQMSEDQQTNKRGGESGHYNSTDPGLPDFVREAIKKLKLGETTAPLQAPMPKPDPSAKPVFFIFRLNGREPAFVQPLESVRDEVKRLALLEKAAAAGGADKKLAEFRKTSQVVISLPGYK